MLQNTVHIDEAIIILAAILKDILKGILQIKIKVML